MHLSASDSDYNTIDSVYDWDSEDQPYYGDKQLWSDPDNEEHMMFSAFDTFYETYDDWSTCMQVTKVLEQIREFWVNSVDHFSMIFVDNNDTPDIDHIYVSVDQGQTLFGASGIEPDVSPYSNSIPDTAGGVTYACFRVIEPT